MNTYKISGTLKERNFGEPFKERYFSITVTAEDTDMAITKSLVRMRQKDIYKLKGKVEVVQL